MIYIKILLGLMAYSTYLIVVAGTSLGYKGLKQPLWLKILWIPLYPFVWSADLLLWIIHRLEAK